MENSEKHFTSEEQNTPSREISVDTQRVMNLYKDENLKGLMMELVNSVDLSDLSKNVEILAKYLKLIHVSWYPVSHYALKNNLIDPKDLYKIFLPSFEIGNNPAHPVGLRYLLSLLLKDRLLNMEQIIAFINGLEEESDIEVLWTMGSNAPVESTNKKVPGMKIDTESDEETGEESDDNETVNPNKAAHLMIYGNSKSWKDDIIEYLTWDVKKGK